MEEDLVETISEEQESNKAKTGDSTIEGSISRGIVSFVSSASKNGYTLTNPDKREGEDGSSLVTCDVENCPMLPPEAPVWIQCCFPSGMPLHLRSEMATAKIQTVKGLKVEFFSRPLRKILLGP